MSDLSNTVGSPEELLARAEILYRFVALFSDYENTSREYGAHDVMSMSEIHVLAHINDHPGITGVELSEAFLITPSAISQILARMESEEYIVRISKKGKRKMAFCTMKGKQLCDAHKAFDINTLTKTFTYLLRDCTPDEILTFYKVMGVYNSIMTAGRKKRLRLQAEKNGLSEQK